MLFPKKTTDLRKKNTKRKISKEVKEYIIERDRVCIICEHEYIQAIHHCYYWDMAMYWEDRNDPEYLVWLCDKDHHILHFEWWNDYRQFCIDYLKNYYGNKS